MPLPLKQLFALSLAALLAGCRRSPPPQFGREYNAERVRRGVTPIGPDWFNYNPWNNGSQATWRPPGAAGATGACHNGKTVLYAGGQIQSEADDYLSGRSVPSTAPEGGTDFEHAVITYSYAAERAGRDPWSCSVPGSPQPVSRAAFDAVLAGWGLKE